MTDQERYALDPTRRWPTRTPGITYRLSASLERSYSVFDRGKRVPAGTTEKEALAKQADIRGRRARGERVIIPTKITLGEVAEEWYAAAERRLRSLTAKHYRADLNNVILPRFGQRGIATIGPQDIVDLIQELEEQGKAPSTIANTLKPLQGTMQHAVFRAFIAGSPFAQVPRGYRPTKQTRDHREWTTEEVERVISVAYQLDGRKESRREYGLIVEVLMRTGLRLGECLGLQFQDVDWDTGILQVQRAWTKENKIGPVKSEAAERRVPLTPALVKTLAARSLELNADPESFVFAETKDGNPPSQSNFHRRCWTKVIEAAKLTDGPRVTPHDARHAFVSQLADQGLSSSDIAPIVGHSSASITEAIYTHAFNRDAREQRVREAMERAQGVQA